MEPVETPFWKFVEDSLTQIITGVSKAQESAGQKGATIGERSGIALDWKPILVEFDLAVTYREGEEAKAGVGVFLADIGIGGRAKIEGAREGSNRIRFSVPVFYPYQEG